MKESHLVDRHFPNSKARVLHELQLCIDRSKKGGIDEPIAQLIGFINELDDYVTTSSCSGRVALFCEVPEAKKRTGEVAD